MRVVHNELKAESIQGIKFDISPNDKVEIIWIADLHFENYHTDKNKLKKLLDENPAAFIVIGGDAFDLMDSFGDPRQSKSRISKANLSDNYINDVTDSFVEFFAPYAKRILTINFGNHESSFLKRHGLDLASNATVLLNKIHKGSIICGDYAGYIVMSFSIDGNNFASKVFYYTHSSGSIGKRSKGTLAIDILKGQHPSADVVITEHDHEAFIKPEYVEILGRNMVSVKQKLMWFVSVPTMKDEFSGKKRGFHHEKNMGKRVIGAIKFDIEPNTNNRNMDNFGIHIEPRFLLV